MYHNVQEPEMSSRVWTCANSHQPFTAKCDCTECWAHHPSDVSGCLYLTLGQKDTLVPLDVAHARGITRRQVLDESRIGEATIKYWLELLRRVENDAVPHLSQFYCERCGAPRTEPGHCVRLDRCLSRVRTLNRVCTGPLMETVPHFSRSQIWDLIASERGRLLEHAIVAARNRGRYNRLMKVVRLYRRRTVAAS